jgi:hypothetical protein
MITDATIESLEESVKKASTAVRSLDVGSPDPVVLQKQMVQTKKALAKLTSYRMASRTLVSEAAARSDMVKGTVARRLSGKVAASSPLMSSIPRLAVMLFGPDDTSDFGISQVAGLGKFISAEDDELLADSLFGGKDNVPTPKAQQSFGEAQRRLQVAADDLDDLISQIHAIRDDIPALCAILKMSQGPGDLG